MLPSPFDEESDFYVGASIVDTPANVQTSLKISSPPAHTDAHNDREWHLVF